MDAAEIPAAKVTEPVVEIELADEPADSEDE
jgi:hypothetical protein